MLTPFFRLALASVGIETFLNTPSNVDCIVSGALLAILLRNGTIRRDNIRKVYRRLALVSAIALTPVLLTALHGFSGRTATVLMAAFKQPPVLGLFAAYALWAVAKHTRMGPPPSRTLRFFVFFGDISYGLYLAHQLVFRLYDRYVAGTALGGFNQHFGLLMVRCLLTSVMATGIAYVSRRYFEDRFLAQKNRLAPYKGDPLKANVPEPGVAPGTETQ